MIRLGEIPLTEVCSVIEARRKIRNLSAIASGDELMATRVATVSSQVARSLHQQNRSPRIDVTLHTAGSVQELMLDFVGDLDEASQRRLDSFFDRVHPCRSEDGLPLTRGIITLQHKAIDEAGIARLEAIVQQKTRDQLLEEIQTKNTELEDSLENLRRTRSAKDRMESELNIGRDIQMSMLPLTFPAFPEQDEFDVHAALYPAQEVGGDFYDMFMIDHDHFCFCVGDVSGKGVPAALFMAVTKTLIKSRAANDLSPASILSHVNTEQSQGNDSCMFVTIFLAVLNLHTGLMTYCNAGHNPPYVRDSSGELLRLGNRHGPVIGAMEGLAYSEDAVQLGTGDLVYLYTDGITEAMNIDRDLYTEERLVATLDGGSFATARDAVSISVDDVWAFQGNAPQADDVTVLAVRFHGSHASGASVEMTHELPNRIEEIEKVNAAFNTFAEQHGIPVSLRRQINLCLDELLSNVISYGYCDDGEHSIEVHVKLLGKELVVTISDDGKPFNPFGNDPPDTGLSLEERPIGGLGVHLVRNVMDQVAYERHGEHNVVQLIKTFDTDRNTDNEHHNAPA